MKIKELYSVVGGRRIVEGEMWEEWRGWEIIRGFYMEYMELDLEGF